MLLTPSSSLLFHSAATRKRDLSRSSSGEPSTSSIRSRTALRVARALATERKARLLITGELCWTRPREQALKEFEDLLCRFDLEDSIDLLGPFSQQAAPEIYRQADILLHTKLNDTCPSAVIEAMACGLPVAFAHSGGVPELVGDTAGVGVETIESWEKLHPADPKELTEAILTIAEDYTAFSEAARQRAVDSFRLDNWLDRHEEVFLDLLQHPRKG